MKIVFDITGITAIM